MPLRKKASAVDAGRRWLRPDSGHSIGSRGSLFGALSVGSVLSFLSVLSIGSAGSILSIGSSGSILSIGSAGSILSIGRAGALLGGPGQGRRSEPPAPPTV